MIKGLSALSEAVKKSGMEILKMADGESKLVRILSTVEEIMGVYEHTEQFDGNWKTVTCLDKFHNKKGICPLCLAQKNASFKAYIPVLDKTDNKVKIFKASKAVVKQILGLVEEYGELTDRDYKIARNGAKLTTTYQFFPKDKKAEDISMHELPDIEDRIAPLPREAILAMMNGSSSDSSSEAASGGVDDDTGEDTKPIVYPF